MNSNQDKKNSKQTSVNPKANDDDFLSGDNKAIYHPNLDEYQVSAEDEDRYNNGTSEHDDLIEDNVSNETKIRYSSPSRNGSHRNH